MLPMRRVDWSLSIQYGDDFETASAAIKEILKSDGRVVKDDPSQAVFVGLKELGDSALILTIRAWCHSADYWGLYFDITQRMYAELPQKGVHFPLPQLDVHLVNN